MNSYKIDEKNLVIDQGLPRYSPGFESQYWLSDPVGTSTAACYAIASLFA